MGGLGDSFIQWNNVKGPHKTLYIKPTKLTLMEICVDLSSVCFEAHTTQVILYIKLAGEFISSIGNMGLQNYKYEIIMRSTWDNELLIYKEIYVIYDLYHMIQFGYTIFASNRKDYNGPWWKLIWDNDKCINCTYKQ